MARMKDSLAAVAACAFLCVLAGCGNATQPSSAKGSGPITIFGAGSTFAAPLYESWATQYKKIHPDVLLEYDSVGSGEGRSRFLKESVDFGASDAALTDEQIASVDRGAQLVPVAAGAIALAYNRLEGLPNGLRLPRNVYVDIFLGKITSWDDPRISEANPKVALPAKPIIVIVRSDKSGTTFAFTNHLAAISEQWRAGPGVGDEIQWPRETNGARRNEGVAGAVSRTPGALGYVEFGVADRANLYMARLENKEGQFIAPTAGSGLATLLSAELPPNLRAFFPDPDGKRSYPIVTYTWLLLYKTYPDPQRATAIRDLVRWGLTDGQRCNEPLGYIRIPPQVEGQALDAVDALGN